MSDHLLGLATVLHSLIPPKDLTGREERVARYLVLLDAHETYDFAAHHPLALAPEPLCAEAP